MLSKISVKKPYTVVVAVVLILILGFVSFTNMTTDLLPSMNLPYAIVMTTYGLNTVPAWISSLSNTSAIT